MAVNKKNGRVFSLGSQEHSVLESLAPDTREAVPALLKAIQDQGGLDELINLLDAVETTAAEVGGMSRLRHCLETLKTLNG
jgi:hypothetical protein